MGEGRGGAGAEEDKLDRVVEIEGLCEGVERTHGGE